MEGGGVYVGVGGLLGHNSTMAPVILPDKGGRNRGSKTDTYPHLHPFYLFINYFP